MKLIYDMGELGNRVFECQDYEEMAELEEKNPPGPFVERVCWECDGILCLSAASNPTFDPDAYWNALEDKRWKDEYQRRAGKSWSERNEPKTHTESHHDIDKEKLDLSEDECLKILGLKPGYSQKELGQAWRRAVKMNHPDKVAELSEEFKSLAEKRTKQLNQAYEFLRKK